MTEVRTIVLERGEHGWLVRDGDRYIDHLTWDEMLGQVATLTHPRLKGESLFHGMMTAEQHAEEDRIRQEKYDRMRA